jgi:hypothetical protein
MLCFTLLTFVITLGTGILVVLSNRAQLVNGARPIPHPLPLPMPLAITLIVLGGWAPGGVVRTGSARPTRYINNGLDVDFLCSAGVGDLRFLLVPG